MYSCFNRLCLVGLLSFLMFSCQKSQTQNSEQFKLAFLSDIHLQNIFGHWSDNPDSGALIPGTSQYVLARTMASQLHSTRLFNENYFAFCSALDQLGAQHIQYVVLSGDFTDDGQPLNVRGVHELLQHYEKKYKFHFFIIPGNHDPVRPFTKDAGKRDYIASDGASQIVESKMEVIPSNQLETHVPIITEDIQNIGYAPLLNELHDYGFFPKKTDLFWATPFTHYSYEDYTYKKAKKQSKLTQREYKEPPYFNQELIDASYLVEPVKGIWLLGIDGNVYPAKEEAANHPENPNNYEGASVGWNEIVKDKPYLLKWMTKVASDAHRLNKKLIVYCHYPMIDFNNHAKKQMQELMGKHKLDLHRSPSEDVSKMLAETGIEVNFAGHIHINNTGFRTYADGHSLVNVQVPSLCAFLPAYKVVRFNGDSVMDIQTVVLDSVSQFKTLFPLYRKEHAYLAAKHMAVWDDSILNVPDYLRYTSAHMDQLVHLRFLKNDWPADFSNFMSSSSGADFYCLLFGKTAFERLSQNEQKGWKDWTGETMISDFYHLRGAGSLAFNYLPKRRLNLYRQLIDQMNNSDTFNSDADSAINRQFITFLKIMDLFLHPNPSGNFQINLKVGSAIGLASDD